MKILRWIIPFTILTIAVGCDTRVPTQSEISTQEYLDFNESNKLAKIDDLNEEFKKSQPIDLYSLKLINDYKIACIILNGLYSKSRLIEFFSEFSKKEKIYCKD